MLIELVTHCWAGELAHYSAALSYHLSSLILHTPKTCEVRATVCYSVKDKLTANTVHWFANQLVNGVQLKPIAMPRSSLGRRSIGRNLAAKSSIADIVWFTDVDYVFRSGCFDALAALQWHPTVTMVFPRQIMIHKDHETGDRELAVVADRPRLLDIDLDKFVSKTYKRAIGGVQIVRGDEARTYGYLQGSKKYQQPMGDGGMFLDFRDDVAYRSLCLSRGKITSIDLPSVYRLRHSTTTYQ